MKIYIAASWKHQHAVEMLTTFLRERECEVKSFVENNHGEQKAHEATKDGKPIPFDDWCWSERGTKSYEFDTHWAMNSDLVVYVGPSGKDAAFECGAAFGRGVPLFALHAKGEDFGLMRRAFRWFDTYRDLLDGIEGRIYDVEHKVKAKS